MPINCFVYFSTPVEIIGVKTYSSDTTNDGILIKNNIRVPDNIMSSGRGKLYRIEKRYRNIKIVYKWEDLIFSSNFRTREAGNTVKTIVVKDGIFIKIILNKIR